jgi:hypothetical protein
VLLLAAYRLLPAIVLERAAQGQTTELLEWEWPCVMAQSIPTDASIRVRAGARVILGAGGLAAKSEGAGDGLSQLLLVADLGTVPVLRYRRMLRVLASLRHAGGSALVESFAEPEIVIATLDPDGTGRRPSAWRELVDRIERTQAGLLRARVVTWTWVANLTEPVRSHGQNHENEHAGRATEGGPLAGFASPAPRHLNEQLLLLIGRHPCLSVTQLASLLGTKADRIRRLQTQLIQDGF